MPHPICAWFCTELVETDEAAISNIDTTVEESNDEIDLGEVSFIQYNTFFLGIKLPYESMIWLF